MNMLAIKVNIVGWGVPFLTIITLNIWQKPENTQQTAKQTKKLDGKDYFKQNRDLLHTIESSRN